MAVFGGYETVRELFRSGLASSCTARRVGERGPARYVVKAYRPFAAEGFAEQLGEDVESFLDAARTQQKAAKGAKYWAPVHEIGQAEGGAYLVTDYHRRSVNRLIRGRVKLDGRRLHGIVSSVVKGLIELKVACGRPHGNLKPTNVLLTGRGDISRANVLLTDPLASGELDPKQGNVADLHALGELIYQLVLHRPGRAMGGWPAPESKEWTVLGKSGDQWRQLCNRLLNPNLAPGLLTMEDLADDLDKLSEGSKLLSARVLVVAAAVLLLAAAGAIGYVALSGKDGKKKDSTVFVLKDWQRLCNEWDGWLRPLLSMRGNGQLGSWERDPYLKSNALPVLDDILRHIDRFDPGRIAKRPYDGVNELAKAPPDDAKKKPAVERTRAALAVIGKLRASFESEKWPPLAKTKAATGRFKQRGWGGAAEYVESILARPDKDLPERVRLLLDANSSLATIDGRWKALSGLQANIENWGDEQTKPLARVAEYVGQRTRSPPRAVDRNALEALAEELKALAAGQSVLAKLAAFVKTEHARRLDMGLIGQAKPPLVPPGANVTEEILLEALKRLEGGEFVLHDPRTAEWREAVKDDVTEIEGNLKSLATRTNLARGKLKDRPDDDKDKKALNGIANTAASIGKSLTSLKRDFQEVGALTYAAVTRADVHGGIDRITKQRALLKAHVIQAHKDLRDLIGRIQQSWSEYVADLQSRPGVSATGVKIIDEKWRAQRQRLIAREKTVEGLSEKIDRLEAFLVELEKDVAEGLGAKVEQRPWNAKLISEEAVSKRRGVLDIILADVPWDSILAGSADPNFSTRKKQLVTTYNDWRKNMVSVIKAFNQIETLLEAGYLLDEKPPQPAPALRELLAGQQQNELFRNPGQTLREAMAPMVVRLNELSAVEKVSDTKRLLAMATAGKKGHFEAARAAWVRLGRVGKPWPGTSAELKQELDVRKNLLAVYGLVADAPRKTKLQQEIIGGSLRRWERYLVSRSEIKQIADAIQLMGEFGVDSARLGSLSPLARYRVLMHDFRGRVAPAAGNIDDNAIKQAVGQFQTKVRALPASFVREQAGGMLGKLEPIRTAVGETVDLSKAGPGALPDWRKTSEAGGTVTYAWRGHGHSLQFVRVTPSVPQAKPCYLCTTEVSLGLFIEVAVATKKWAEMIKLMGNVEDPREGPRVWVVEAGNIRKSPTWVFDTPLLEGKHYPDSAKPPEPDLAHPMQHVSLPAAIYLARLLGCRLPTYQEWLAAHELDRKTPDSRLPNLRDKAWAVQRDFAKTLEEAGTAGGGVGGKVGPEFYPNAAIFWPKGTTAQEDRKTAPALNQDDKVLWFEKVGSRTGRTFHHLTGNVAEYVFEKPDALAKLKSPTAASVKAFAKAQGASARVVGGSALSPPGLARDKPHELDLAVAGDGFSDVGFRLAFFAGKERLQNRLWQLLTGMSHGGYLAPASTSGSGS